VHIFALPSQNGRQCQAFNAKTANRISSNTSTTRNLQPNRFRDDVWNAHQALVRLTKILLWIAPALPSPVRLALRAVLEGLVSVANVIEEVDLIFAREQRSTDAVDRSVSPALAGTY
jgi:hypothetical protein